MEWRSTDKICLKLETNFLGQFLGFFDVVECVLIGLLLLCDLNTLFKVFRRLLLLAHIDERSC